MPNCSCSPSTFKAYYIKTVCKYNINKITIFITCLSDLGSLKSCTHNQFKGNNT